MFVKLAKFAHTYRRRVLFVAVIAAAIAAVLGIGVAKRLSPYSATDPATQSAQAERRFEAAAGRKIDPGIVAIVSAGAVGSPAVERRVGQVVTELRGEPDVAGGASFYQNPEPAT